MKPILVVAFALAATLASGQTLTVAATSTTKPIADLVVKALAEGGISAEVTFVPRARLLNSLKDASVQAGFFVSDEALSQMPGASKASPALTYTEVVAVTVDPKIKITGVADLAAYRVGVINGDRVQAALTKGLKVTATGSMDSQFKMLAAGRFDVALGVRAVVPAMLKAAGIQNAVVHEPPLDRSPLFFVLSSAGADQKAKVTAAFQKVVDNGTWHTRLKAVLAGMAQ